MNSLDRIAQRLKESRHWDHVVETELLALWRHGIERVSDPRLRSALVHFLEEVAPVGFFVNPASSTGRYHPGWQLRRAGILRNTVECCLAIDRQLRIYPELTDDQADPRPSDRDIVLAATILSDTFKYGEVEITGFTSESKADPHHGRTAAEKWKAVSQSFGLEPAVADPIHGAVYWHLGRFTPGWKAGTAMSIHSFITHQIDMFFSDRNLELIFESRLRVED